MCIIVYPPAWEASLFCNLLAVMFLWTNMGIGVKKIQDILCFNMDKLRVMCMDRGFLDIMQSL